MKTAKTYALYSTLMLSFALILMTSMLLSQKTQEHYQIKQEQVSVFERYKAVLNLESTSIRQITHDHSRWDEMVAFGNEDILAHNSDNVASLLPSFHISSIFIFDASKKPVFSHKIAILDSINPNLSTFNPSFSFLNGFSC